jgi:DNA-binding PadR family transcriptional regulator
MNRSNRSMSRMMLMTGHRARHGWGPGGPPTGPFGPPPGFGRRGGRRRGDVRSAVLRLLAEQPMHGYQVIQELQSRSGGAWKPSPGSVYPTLQQLEDEGLVKADEVDGRRTFKLTEAGQAEAAKAATAGKAPWDTAAEGEGEGIGKLRDLAMQVAAATMQVAHAGTAAQVEQASAILRDTRKALYRILADGDDES